MESEIRAILVRAVSESNHSGGLFATLLERFAAVGGVEFDPPTRSPPAGAADLSA
jgi:hypothetical protein